MNILSMFEERIGSIFGTSISGHAAPFSFKRLAKKAAQQMENETYVVNGTDTAPGLYTILVSPEDDQLMRPLYKQLTTESSQLIEAQAAKKGYVFVGKPLVRFMADPSIKNGKFEVFAENVDARTLSRLREEESEFLTSGPAAGIHTPVAPHGAGSQAAAAATAGVVEPIETPVQNEEPQKDVGSAIDADGDEMDGFDKIPADVMDGYAAGPATVRRPSTQDAPPKNYLENGPAQEETEGQQGKSIAALLIDRQSGRTYTATAPRTVIGRERTTHGIVLRDPNVSRQHAELSYENGNWKVADLNSTNGTLVNDVDIDECLLRDGDLITLGLITLEFKED